MEYNTEEEFLKNYHISDFKQLSMTTDLLLISVSESENTNYRKANNKKMSILLVKRDTFPYKDMWTLPGGFLNPLDETLEECAKRILKQEVNLSNIYLEQLYTFDSLNRDPRCRVVSCAYIALVDKDRLGKINEKASWFDIEITEHGNDLDIVLDNGNIRLNYKVKKELKEKTTDRYNYKVLDNVSLAFDHSLVIVTGIERLRNKISYTDIVFNMMPKYFTLGELQRVYEVILGKKLLDPAFRRMIKEKVEKSDIIKTDGGHRPSIMYRYRNNKK